MADGAVVLFPLATSVVGLAGASAAFLLGTNGGEARPSFLFRLWAGTLVHGPPEQERW